jgi:hypothetical protein
MMGYIIKELQWKANHSKSDGFTTVFDIGVVKSDTAIPEELRKALVDEVAPLENIPDDQKDYHPRSNQKVLDLVHPSLFPLVYGRSRILSNKSIGLKDCLGTIGQGELVTVPSTGYEDLYSRKFQWLPCDVELRSTETKHECRIISYINNLHPGRHLALYNVIEMVIARTIPMWNRTLTGEKYNNHRIEYSRVEKDHDGEPEPEREPEESDRQYWLRRVAWERTGAIKQPEPKEFMDYEPDERMDIQKQFGDTGLQVIVKLANIELSPEKPEYEGGSWHIEGQLVNENQCKITCLSFILLTFSMYRMSASVQQLSTTTTAKISQKVSLRSANVLTRTQSRKSITTKENTNSSKISTDLVPTLTAIPTMPNSHKT